MALVKQQKHLRNVYPGYFYTENRGSLIGAEASTHHTCYHLLSDVDVNAGLLSRFRCQVSCIMPRGGGYSLASDTER